MGNIERYKKPKSSLPGADIVGLYQQTDDTFFLFGEIKTSSHSEYPPSVMYGEHGLKKQLEDLCENKDITDKLAVVPYHILLAQNIQSRNR